MDPLSDVLGGNSNVGRGVDHIETTLSATEAVRHLHRLGALALLWLPSC